MFTENQTITFTVQDLGSNGEGIGKIDGFTVFVDGVLPGEVVDVRITQVKKNYAKGVVEKIIHSSPFRIKPLCPVFEQCGGCQLQHLSYEGQLLAKQKRVKDALERIGHLKIEVNPCIPSPSQYAYRNKIQLPVAMSSQGIKIGFYQHRTHRIIDIDSCPIHCQLGNEVFRTMKPLLLNSSIAPYDEISGQGELRHCLIKTAKNSSEVLVVLITNGEASVNLQIFAEAIFKTCPAVKGVVQNINSDRMNAILGNEYHTLAGRPYIYESIGGYRFKISSASFFQVNPEQAEQLYECAIHLADIRKNHTVVDAYCGVGTLSLLLSKHSDKVIGIECVPEAISDAKENAELNRIENVQFFLSKTEKAIHLLQKADLVFLNPPRKGCDRSVIQALSSHQAKIVYISCDPATLARDLLLLKNGGYRIIQVQPLDMFPQTSHVETVALLIPENSS